MTTTRTRNLFLGLAVAAVTLAPTAALAKKGGNDGKRVAGTCSKGSTAKLKVKPDNGRLETEFEVDQNRNGVTWKVTIKRNGRTAVSTNATTRAPSGSFSVQRRIANGSGSDRITAKATRAGETCTASVTI
jgi:hypothetical protein